LPITKLADIFEGNNDRHPYLILELSDGTTATVRAGNLEDVLLWRYTLTIPGRPAQEETGSKELGVDAVIAIFQDLWERIAEFNVPWSMELEEQLANTWPQFIDEIQ